MFRNRTHAGQLLAKQLTKYKTKKGVLVLAIPRGGVAVAREIADELHAPLDVVIVRKIGAPGNEELAIGAASHDDVVLNKDVISYLGVSPSLLQQKIQEKQKEVKERYHLFRGKKKPYDVKNKIIVLVDDGVATGATISAAIIVLKNQKPKKIVVAIPVAPPDTVQRLQKEADEVICLETPLAFMAIGQFYGDFTQVEDDEVVRLLQ
ncbi:phosphoribosyltransferase [Candidatus Woesearchaeota archaeon]|nr:phosphoribosyltransferase [Candidatus Woesearchaeota archaeon]